MVNQPPERAGLTTAVRVGGMTGYITANYSDELELYEVFVHGFGKSGSTNQGWTDAFAITLSLALQAGTPLRPVAKQLAKLKFEPNGETDNPAIPFCYSIPDFILRWLVHHFGSPDTKEELKKIHAEMERV